MQPTKVDKMHSPRGYNAVRPPTTQTPGSRGGTPAKHGGSRTPGTGGRGAFTGSPPAVTAGCDWGSPHKTGKIPSTGRGA